MVLQEPHLFSGTVRGEHPLWTARRATDDEVESVRGR